MKRAALLACVLGGCHSNHTATTRWPFDPVAFFTGHTHGEAALRMITGARHRVSIDSYGVGDGHGGLRLDQGIREEGKAPRARLWILHPSGPNRWSGTLTDAKGPVEVERMPSEVVITYRMKNGANVEQHLQLPPGGIAQNHMEVTRLGLKLAALDERIRKLGT